MPAVTDTRQGFDALFEEISGWAHVHNFCPAGITLGSCAAHKQHALRVDFFGGIIDAVVEIFGAFKDDRAAFKSVRVIWIGQICRAERGADHGGFHQGAVEQIALHIDKTCLRL